MDGMAGAGYEGMTAQDVQIPFLRILQALSPQVTEGGDEFVPGAKPGYFFNSLTNRVYGNSISLIPVKFETLWLEWTTGERGKLVARHAPGSITIIDGPNYKKYTESGNEIVETMMFYCLVAGATEEGVIIFSLSKTGIKHGKRWNTLISTTKLPNGKTAPYFSSVWTLKTQLNKNEKGVWYTLGVKSVSNIARERFITKDEFTMAVQPALDVLKDVGTQKAIAAGQAAQGLLTDNTDY
jgi:hypothetical protein